MSDEHDALAERIAVAGNAAINAWGTATQLRMVQEECAELAAAINQFLRGRITAQQLALELADVVIVTTQLRIVLGISVDCDGALAAKLSRLETRLGIQPGAVAP